MEEKKRKQQEFQTLFYRLFDRLFVSLPIKGLEKVYWKYREFFLYTFFGIGTFAVCIGVYAFFSECLGWSVLVANVIAWFFSTTFAFLTNRTWVFLQRFGGKYAFWVQCYSFFLGRFGTLVIEEVCLMLLVNRMGLPNVQVKLGLTVLVILLNYIISKLLVFRRKNNARSYRELDRV